MLLIQAREVLLFLLLEGRELKTLEIGPILMLHFQRGRVFGFVVELKYLYSTT
jgi:hypothetical protein